MFVAALFATIATAATSFLLWFLAGLLRESTPSARWRIVPVCRCMESKFGPSGASDADRDLERERTGFCVELAGEQFYAKKRASGLVSLHAGPALAASGPIPDFKSARLLRQRPF